MPMHSLPWYHTALRSICLKFWNHFWYASTDLPAKYYVHDSKCVHLSGQVTYSLALRCIPAELDLMGWWRGLRRINWGYSSPNLCSSYEYWLNIQTPKSMVIRESNCCPLDEKYRWYYVCLGIHVRPSDLLPASVREVQIFVKEQQDRPKYHLSCTSLTH